VFDGKSLAWPGVKDPRFWEPVIRQLLHPSPAETTFLAASAKQPSPASDDLVSKGIQRSPVCWHCVVPEVARDNLLQPSRLLGDWLMHSPSQLPSDLFEFRLHAIASGPPLEEEFPSTRLAAYEREPEEMSDPTFPRLD
jgi:hypothetical protein